MAFIDDPADRRDREALREYRVDLCIPETRPTAACVASLRGLLTGEALSPPYLRNAEMRRRTRKVLE